MRPLFALLAAVALLPLLGVAFALFQLAWYRWRVALGRLQADQVPWFGALVLRGMIAGLVVMAALAVNAHLGRPAAGGAATAAAVR